MWRGDVKSGGASAAWRWAVVAGVVPCGLTILVQGPAGIILALCAAVALLWAARRAMEALVRAPVASDAAQVSETRRLHNSLRYREGEVLLGVVRLANYPAMSSFDAVAAERVLLVFAQRLKLALGSKRQCERIDAHTVAICFDGADARETAEAELKSVAYVLAQEIADVDMTVLPDVHVGAAWAVPGEEPVSLIARAQAMVAPLKLWSQLGEAASGVQEALAERFALEQALRRAVREGQLYLEYQPFVDVEAARVIGAEALLRWRHPTLGNVSPSKFVPLLEETGLIHEIGLWTLDTACRQLSAWRSHGQGGLHLAINLSAVQLQNPTLAQVIERVVCAHGLVPADIELELTETAALEDRSRTRAAFQALRARGFGIAIDDFGNGHSNLSYLSALPFTKLKIDREFVSDADKRPGSQAICKALVQLTKGLGISVLAEGVERFEEVQELRRLGCNVFQGFYFARPMSADNFMRRLSDNDWLRNIASDVQREQTEVQRRLAVS